MIMGSHYLNKKMKMTTFAAMNNYSIVLKL